MLWLTCTADGSSLTQLQSTPLHFVTGRFGNRGDHLCDSVKNVMETLIKAGVDPTATNSVSTVYMCISVAIHTTITLCVIMQNPTLLWEYSSRNNMNFADL